MSEEEIFTQFVAGLDYPSLLRLLRILYVWSNLADDAFVQELRDALDSAFNHTSTILDEVRSRHEP